MSLLEVIIHFFDNAAGSGGSIYLSDGMLTLSGASLFFNNTSLSHTEEVVNRTMLLCNYQVERSIIGSGGAILCITSYLRVCEHSNFTANVANSTGGALLVDAGGLTIQDSALFSRNTAGNNGDAMLLYFTSSNFSRNFSLSTNKVKYSGAIAFRNGTFIIQENILFYGNSAKDQGGALHLAHVNFEFCGSIYFGSNIANDRGGAIYIHDSKALIDDKCSTHNPVTVSSITFIHNVAKYGGSIYCWNVNTMSFVGTMYFNESHESAIRT